MTKKKISWTPDEFNTLINGFIFKYSIFIGMDIKEAYEKMEQFYQKFQNETKTNEQSIQHGQDDQTKS